MFHRQAVTLETANSAPAAWMSVSRGSQSDLTILEAPFDRDPLPRGSNHSRNFDLENVEGDRDAAVAARGPGDDSIESQLRHGPIASSSRISSRCR